MTAGWYHESETIDDDLHLIGNKFLQEEDNEKNRKGRFLSSRGGGGEGGEIHNFRNTEMLFIHAPFKLGLRRR